METNQNNANFDSFYKKHFNRAVNNFKRWGKLSTEVAEELSQEVFIKVYRNWGGFRGETSLVTWLDIVCKNVYLNYLRGQTTSSRKGINHPYNVQKPLKGINTAPSNKNPEQHALDQEKKMRLQDEIESLPKKTKIVVEMRLNEYSFKEIARSLQSSVETVRSQFGKALKHIREKNEP